MSLRNSDFDGNGRAEIPVTSPWGIGVLDLAGNTLAAPVMAANGTRFDGWLLNTADNRFDLLADLDGDGKAEIVVTSPWGVGVLKREGNTFRALAMAPNGTRFGGWLLNTADNRFGPAADYDGDGKEEILVTSPWGIGILKLSGTTFSVLMMAPNGTRFGGWLLNTADNRFGPVGDVDGDVRAEILVTSPWGVGLLELSGGTLAAQMMAPNGTRFGGWLLNTADNHFGNVADYDGDGRREILVTSPWGLGVLKLVGATFSPLMMAANGTRFGGWLLNTLDNRFGPASDYDGDGRDELLVASPWGLGILELSGGTLAAPIMAPNGTRFGGWLLNTADNHFGMETEMVRVHVKILTDPTISIDQMLVAMRQVYEAVGIRVQLAGVENLNLPALDDVDVGSCALGEVTSEQAQLFANRNNVAPGDIVVYFVRSTVPPFNGCAAHPADRPGAVVAQGATQWTLAHEIGHVLSLRHVDDNNRLMTGNGTGNITNPPPDLSAQEVIAMRAQTLTHAE
jgi:acyl-CoA hydrolase